MPINKRFQGTLYFRNIPRALKDMFKGVASSRGDSMQDVIVTLMREYVDDPGKFKIKKETDK